MKSMYKIAFWYKEGGSPDLVVEAVSEGPSTWNMDEAFREMMIMHQVSSVVYATFALYNQDFPEGISVHRWGLTLENDVYSYAY